MKDLEKIKKEVFKKRPVLGEILKTFGKQTLIAYANNFSNRNSNVLIQRQNEFVETLGLETSHILGKEVAERVKKQVSKNYFVSTADHLGPLSHPFFLHTNMLAGLINNQELTDWVVLACSNVSLNNSSYPRGLQVHVKEGNILQLKQFSFFPSLKRHASVFGLKSYGVERLNKITNILPAFFSKEQTEAFTNIYGEQDVLSLKNYSDQITVTNQRLFKNFFKVGSNSLNLVYLNQENLTIRLLANHFKAKTEISSLLFEPELHNELNQAFQGIPGAFSLKEHKGTFLFWGYDQRTGLRIRLLYKNSYLESEDGLFKIHLDSESVSKALNAQLLIPSMLLNMLVVGGYYGVKCLGGFSQTTYLGKMLESYKQIFPKAVVGDSGTLCGDLTFADIKFNKSSYALTGLDLLLYQNQADFEKFENLCKTKILEEVVEGIMPILHKILYANESNFKWPKISYKPDFTIDPKYANSIIEL